LTSLFIELIECIDGATRKAGQKRFEISAYELQNDSLRASWIRRGLFTVEFTAPNPAALTSFTGKPN